MWSERLMSKELKNKMFKTVIAWLGRENVKHILKRFNHIFRKVTSKLHSLQMKVEWEMQGMPVPEWFDHYLDMYYQWEKTRNPLWLERGIFSSLAINKNGSVLELCCGDGFNAKYFYSIKAKSILSVDFDKNSIAHAQKYNKVENVTFQLADIRHRMPEGIFDTIIWDAAIEHFTELEIDALMKNIKLRLTHEGVLSGYTIVRRQKTQAFVHHEYEFKSKEDLMQFLTPYFQNVKVFETIYPSRHNLYFWASDDIIPFDAKWEHQITRNDKKQEEILL